MKKVNLFLEDLVCPSCVLKIEKSLKANKAIDKESVKVFYNAGKVNFNYKPKLTTIEKILATIEDLGFNVIKFSESDL